ncbi:3-hydroxybutyryl-CoA dehydratase [Desulfotomaculum arcticum]|uniref:3-hydroxybutyryl-CoA dehydratase n=1 Tax=Desulfotruncus arcticus DSM 17038 TaxID=1121424 RepID=A0A1I2XLX4_9FIRM|nr:MaoC family dehydratase [Desulfotruncus arcticus]SFH14460.1 3-hydroxybutyryl-CoA dehydratase [Desulfotomaculum arcticum] [Desulfotruncus arcticus DSM 17038]
MSKYDLIQVGAKESFAKTITETDIALYGAISGDFNPVHFNSVYAAGTMFKNRIAHGMLTAGLISALLGTRLPGPGTVYLSQSLNFRAPVYIGDTITAEVEVLEKYPEKKQISLKTTCINQNGKEVVAGEALVMYKE